MGIIGTLITIFITQKDPLDKIIAVKWGDGKYGKAFYGAEVYFDKKDNVYSVKARIRLGRGNDYFHECGEIGIAHSLEEAVLKYSDIEWTPEGLIIGKNESEYFIKRSIIEAHR